MVKWLLGEITQSLEELVLKSGLCKCYQVSKEFRIPPRSKQIEIRQYFIWEKRQDDVFGLEYVSREAHIAHILTKPLVNDRFSKFRDLLGIKKLPA